MVQLASAHGAPYLSATSPHLKSTDPRYSLYKDNGKDARGLRRRFYLYVYMISREWENASLRADTL